MTVVPEDEDSQDVAESPQAQPEAVKTTTEDQIASELNGLGGKSLLVALHHIIQSMDKNNNIDDIQLKQKTLFSPEHIGRPAFNMEPAYRFPTYRKRGPKRKHTMDGVDRQSARSLNEVVEITGKKGGKSPRVAVKYRGDTLSTWVPEAQLVTDPRLKLMFESFVAKKKELDKAKRAQHLKRKQEQNSDSTISSNQPSPTNGDVEPLVPSSVGSGASVTVSCTESGPSQPSHREAGPSTVPSLSEVRPSTPPSSGPSDVESKGLSVSSPPPALPTAAPMPKRKSTKRKAKPSPQSVDTEKTPVKRTSRKRSYSARSPDNESQQAIKKRELDIAIQRIHMDIPAAANIPDDHLLLSPPYHLSPYMIERMKETKNIQLVPVSSLLPHVEFNRRVNSKYGDNATVAIHAMQSTLRKYGIGDEVLIRYSLKDGKAMVVEGNLRIAAARDMDDIKYLPARVVAVREETPRRVGALPPSFISSKTTRTHFSPSDIGLPFEKIEL